MQQEHHSRLERIIHSIEERIEEWRKEDAARKMEAEANREMLWAEAAQREEILKEAIEKEEAQREEAVEGLGKRQKPVFVVHTDEVAETLRVFAEEGDRLVRIMPGSGANVGGTGLSGSWLIFEVPED